MLKHVSNVYMCRKRTGTHIGMVCHRCDDRCVICDGYAHLESEVHICDDCNFATSEANNTFSGAGGTTKQRVKCMVCGHMGAENPAMYCAYCVRLEKDRDGCPRVMAVSESRRDAQIKMSVSID